MLLKLLKHKRAGQASTDLATPDHDSTESQVHTFDGHRLVLGLTWTEADSLSEAKRFAGKNNSYLTREIAGQLYVGAATKQTVGVLAAGALIGHVAPNAFIYQQLQDNRYWICLLRDGIPMPSFDRIVPAQEAQQIYTDATAYMAPGSEIIGNFAVAKVSLEDVLSSAAELPKKVIQECRLRKNGPNTKKIALWLVAALLVTLAGQLALAHKEQLKSEEQRQAMLRSLMLSQEQKAAQDKRIAQLVTQFKERIAKAEQSFGQQGVALHQFSQCEKVRKDLPLSMYGYKPSKLTCDFKSEYARIEWLPVDARTRLSDRTKLPGVLDPLNTANPVVSEVALGKGDLHGSSAATVNAAVVKMTILDWAQRNIHSMRFGVDETVSIAPDKEIRGLPGIQTIQLGSKSSLHIHASAAKEILLLELASQVLNQFPIAFESMSWTAPVHPGARFQSLAILYIRQ